MTGNTITNLTSEIRIIITGLGSQFGSHPWSPISSQNLILNVTKMLPTPQFTHPWILVVDMFSWQSKVAKKSAFFFVSTNTIVRSLPINKADSNILLSFKNVNTPDIYIAYFPLQLHSHNFNSVTKVVLRRLQWSFIKWGFPRVLLQLTIVNDVLKQPATFFSSENLFPKNWWIIPRTIKWAGQEKKKNIVENP